MLATIEKITYLKKKVNFKNALDGVNLLSVGNS